MRTALFVYQPTRMTISTREDDVQLCRLDHEIIPLANGANERYVERGIYKIISSQEVDVDVAADRSVFELVKTDKTSIPTLPARATETFQPIDSSVVKSFFTETDARELPAL